jgi:hypothetical protein
MLVAQVIAGQAPTHDLTPFRPDRFELGSRAPAEAPPPFTAGVP